MFIVEVKREQLTYIDLDGEHEGKPMWAVYVGDKFVWRWTKQGLAEIMATNISYAVNGDDTRVLWVEKVKTFEA